MSNQTVDESINILAQALSELAAGKTAPFNQDYFNFAAENGKSNYNKGLIFTGYGSTKQLVLVADPDRFFISEHIDLAKDKYFAINNVNVLSATELGSSVRKSNLTEIGRLKGLIVDGGFSINQYMFYFADSDRLAIGTEEPNAALSVAEDDIEIVIGTGGTGRAKIGTHAYQDFDVVTDNKARISIAAGGDIALGNVNSAPISVKVNGTMSLGVETPDNRATLHVNGPIKFNNTLHITATRSPVDGNFNIGDIVWNSQPRVDSPVGWVCTRAGNPGVWNPFGQILPA